MAVSSLMVPLGTQAPGFTLPDTRGTMAGRDDFTAAGVNHVLSISGLHVGMLGVVVFFAVRFLGSLSETAIRS